MRPKQSDAPNDPGHAESWQGFYGKHRALTGRYPTEWVVRTLAGGNYPRLKMNKAAYRGARILDMGCGDGRNLPLLLDLGFEVHATEINAEIVRELAQPVHEFGWPVSLCVGANHELPYPDRFFDYLLCCASCYYLDDTVTWAQVRTELARVLKPGGILVANFCDEENFILKDAVRQEDGSFLITSDPYGLRNGSRFVVARDQAEVQELLAPMFDSLAIGHVHDDFFGITVSGNIVVAQAKACLQPTPVHDSPG